MRNKRQREKTHRTAGAILKQVLADAAIEDPARYQKIVKGFHGKIARVLFEDSNEEFHVRGDDLGISVVVRQPTKAINIKITLSREVISNILRGQETPVEAFFLGHLRAEGSTNDLYQLHRLFISMAEIAVRSERMHATVEELTEATVRGQ
jgi:hypothetical protein